MALLVAALAACSSVPREQTVAFSDMVANVGTSVDPLFDRVSVAERRYMIKQAEKHPTLFTVDQAAYFATIGDAPAASQFRAGFDVIRSYAKLLVSLVDGSSAAAWQSEAQGALASVTALAGAVGITVPGGAALAGPLKILFGDLATARSNAEARRLVLSGKKPMIELIDALIAAGDPIFQVLVQDDTIVSGKTKEERKADIDAARVQVSNYIVLLGQLKRSFARLDEAFLRQTNPESLRDIAAIAGGLAVDVRAARAAYAALGGH